MGTTVDSLDIQISAQAAAANRTLDALTKRLDRITTSLNRAGGSGIGRLSLGISGLSSAARKMSNVDVSSISKLANGMNKMASVDASKISSSVGAISQLADSLKAFQSMDISEDTKDLAALLRAISLLGGKASTQAVVNIPKLAIAMRDLMTTLSTAPHVSQNLIDMTNALANLARTGSSSGKAVSSLSGVFDRFSASSIKARKHSFNLASAIGKLYASYWIVFRLFGKLGDAMDLSSKLTEVQNVVAQTFGEYSHLVDQMADTSITDYGMSELTVKKTASKFQAMGVAMGVTQGKMAEMSLELTKLTADMASFYNVEQDAVAEGLASIFTGETRPLREYGLDLTQATLQEWAMKQGIDAKVSSMSQAEKAMLRYQYVMAHTTAVQGDFAATANTWANQTRILSQNFAQLGRTIGNVLINVFKPVVSWLNSIMNTVISVVETIANALGAMFGWTIEIFPSGATSDMSDFSDSVGDTADGLGNATDKANELKRALMGFDEIEKLPDPSDSAGSSGGPGGSSGTGGDGGTTQLVRVDSMFEKYQSEIKTLEGLGVYIRDALITAMNSIDWGSIYHKAIRFGSGLANFLNGLFSEDENGQTVFSELGDTIAGALNSELLFLNTFGTLFKWEEFGNSIASGINNYFDKFDFNSLASTVNVLSNGILDALISALDNVDWTEVGSKIGAFFEKIDWKTILLKTGKVIIGAIEAAFSVYASAFNAAPLETGIMTAISLFKFTGVGLKLGSSLFSVNNLVPLLAKSGLIGDEIAAKIINGITAGFTLARMGLVLAAFNVWASELTGGAELLGNSIKDKLSEVLGKEDWSKGIPFLVKFSSNLRETWPFSMLSWNDQDETPEIEVEVNGDSEPLKTEVSGAVDYLNATLPNETAVDIDANTNPANANITKFKKNVSKKKIEFPFTTKITVREFMKQLDKKGITDAEVPVKTKVSTEPKDFQSLVSKLLDNYEAGVEAGIVTDAPVIRDMLNNLVSGWRLGVGAEVSTTPEILQFDLQSHFDGFTAQIDANANLTSTTDKIGSKDLTGFTALLGNKKDNIGSNNKDLTGFTAVASVFKDDIAGAKKVENVSAYASSVGWQSGASKALGILAKASGVSWKDGTSNSNKNLTVGARANGISWLSSAAKTLSDVTAYVIKAEKKPGLTSLVLSGITALITAATAAQKADGGVFANGKWSPITAYAGGGSPITGQMFVAREAGPELVGTLGGHTAVMNNDQIVASVSAGVYQAVRAAMAESGGNSQVNVVLEGDAGGIFRVVQRENNRMVMATGRPALLT